jgi:ParB family chromosome partitioning protein
MFIEIKMSDLILSKKNVRKVLSTEDDETSIKNLAESIKENGLINPLTVLKTQYNQYEIIAGQRRFMALQEINVKSVMCNVIEDMTEEKCEILSFTENIQRNKMAQQDKCYVFQKLFSKYGEAAKVAKICGYSVPTVKNYIFLSENLCIELQNALDAKGESKLSIEIALLIAHHLPKEKQFEVYEMLCPLGTTEMKRQAILKMVEPDQHDDSELPDAESEKEPTEKEPSEKKKPFPKQPWVFDENGEYLVIPVSLYPEICQIVKNNS